MTTKLRGMYKLTEEEWEALFQRLLCDEPPTARDTQVLVKLLTILAETHLLPILPINSEGVPQFFESSKESDARWEAAQAVFDLVYKGVNVTEAVNTVECNLECSPTPLKARTIWKAYSEIKKARETIWVSPFPDVTE